MNNHFAAGRDSVSLQMENGQQVAGSKSGQPRYSEPVAASGSRSNGSGDATSPAARTAPPSNAASLNAAAFEIQVLNPCRNGAMNSERLAELLEQSEFSEARLASILACIKDGGYSAAGPALKYSETTGCASIFVSCGLCCLGLAGEPGGGAGGPREADLAVVVGEWAGSSPDPGAAADQADPHKSTITFAAVEDDLDESEDVRLSDSESEEEQEAAKAGAPMDAPIRGDDVGSAAGGWAQVARRGRAKAKSRGRRRRKSPGPGHRPAAAASGGASAAHSSAPVLTPAGEGAAGKKASPASKYAAGASAARGGAASGHSAVVRRRRRKAEQKQPSIKLTPLFFPSKESFKRILRVFREAEQSIDLAVYNLTENAVRDELAKAWRYGVRVRVITDQDNLDEKRGADAKYLARQGVEVRILGEKPTDRGGGHMGYKLMHNKFIIADRSTLVTGSLNLTRSATRSNNENMLVVEGATLSAVEAYEKHFEMLWAKGKPL